MCGIAGFIDLTRSTPKDELERLAMAMADAITHRGPDGFGVWGEAETGAGLGQRRLSIIDLSSAGRQPMFSPDGRFVIVYNGEIYNFQDIRNELESAGLAPEWRGHSDTEVLLAAVQAWGLERTLKRTTGMFALALFDRSERVLHLARDRMGEKPLYYGKMRGTILFGSELKALRAHPAFAGEVDPSALLAYLRLQYVPAPLCIYDSVRKLPPGTVLTLSLDPDAPLPEPRAYWSMKDAAARAMADPFTGTEDQAVDALDGLLRTVVGNQMISDVPLGAFLSGGIDSSLVTALMQAQSDRPVRTFTIGFTDKAYDESKDSAAVARHLGTDHTELTASPDDGLEVIARLPELFDEPFADASQIPTFLVSRLTRAHVSVCLSGDGGDEMFAGYNRHFWAPALLDRFGPLPRVLRQGLAAGLSALSPSAWNRIFSALDPVLPERFRQRMPGYKLHKLAEVLPASGPEDMYRRLTAVRQHPERLLARGGDAGAARRLPEHPDFGPGRNGFTRFMQYMDAATYLPDDIMVKVDRAAMGVSLESRAPYLDHRVFEFAWRLPMSMKTGQGKGKLILRRLLSRYVPESLFERPKMGFGVPIDAWLRGPLRSWAEGLLNEKRMADRGLINPAPVRAAWKTHLSGRRDLHYPLWNILMFQAWLERWN